MNLFLVIWLFPSVIFLSLTYLEYKAHRFSDKNELAAFIAFLSMPFFNIIFFLTWLGLGDFAFLEKIRTFNEAGKCKTCEVTSRMWQIPNIDGEKTCPVCHSSMQNYKAMHSSGHYPFAKKLNTFGGIAYLLREAKMKKIKEKMEALTAYDQELEAYQKIQFKKMENYEQQAMKTIETLKKQG